MTKKTIEGILNIEESANPAQNVGDLFVDSNSDLLFDHFWRSWWNK